MTTPLSHFSFFSRLYAGFLVCTSVGGILFAPQPLHAQTAQAPSQNDEQTIEARIEALSPLPCPDDSSGCLQLQLRVTRGAVPERDFTLNLTPQDFLGGNDPGFSVGDTLLVQTQMIDGTRIYAISDVVRRNALRSLTLLFLAAVIALGGFAAVRSLLGMLLSFAVMFFAMIPLILQGYSPLLVSIVSAFIIMTATFLLSHGWNAKTHAALGGTAISLLLTGLLAWIFSGLAHLTGLSEETLFLLSDYPTLDTRGILLAGILIGSLGVLDDITISQASAVMELRAANPALTVRELFVRALRIGKDHISAAVNTLILAYTGSSLPLLLLLIGQPNGEPWTMLLNREVIATEIVRTLVGSIGLLSAVPLTTWLASVLAHRLTADKLPAHHGHTH